MFTSQLITLMCDLQVNLLIAENPSLEFILSRAKCSGWQTWITKRNGAMARCRRLNEVQQTSNIVQSLNRLCRAIIKTTGTF